MTVKVTPPLVPFEVVTVTVRSPLTAAGSIEKAAVKVVELVTLTELTVTPVPLTVIEVAPVTKFVPVNVTMTFAFWLPLFGEMPLSVGFDGACGVCRRR